MAVVINGSGTVTGLAVGGLPDGTVDSDTLASNAVTEAKIASSAVVTAKLNDDAVTNAKMANDAITEHELAGNAVVTAAINDDAITAAKLASGVGGKVLQVKEATAFSVVASNPSDHTTLYSLTITPTSSSSKILVTAVVGGLYLNYGGNQNNTNWRIARGNTTPTGSNSSFQTEVGRSATGTGERAYITMHLLDEPNTTSATTYNVQLIRINGSGGVSIGDTSGTSSITCMEIGA